MGHNGFPAGRGSASAFSFSAGRGFAAAPIGTIAPILLAREKESSLHRHFEKMMQALWEQKGATLSVNIVTDPRAIDFIDAHADTLNSSFTQVEMSERMRARLERSTWIFSGMKAIREMGEAFPSLLDENGERKPFERFLNDVRKVDETYNQHYLRAEYEFAAASAQMAAKWERFAEDGDRYNLQYRTAGDDRVRPEHAALDGITLPPSDSFWESYFPPNGWRCRCDVVQVRKSKYPETPHDEAMQLGEMATAADNKNIFRFNPGIQQRVFPAANPYTSSKCNGCELGAKEALAKDEIPTGTLCQGCRLLQEYYHKIKRKLSNDTKPPHCQDYSTEYNGKVMISPYHGADELSENKRIAEFISKRMEVKVYLLPCLDPGNPQKASLRSSLLPAGVFEKKNPDYYIGGLIFDAKSMMDIKETNDTKKWKNDIENRIKGAKKQADNIVLEIPDFITRKVIHSTIINYLNRSHKKRIILVKWKERLLLYG